MSDMKYYASTSSHGGMVQVAKFEDAYVKVSDHEAEAARLRAEAKGLSQALTDALACEQDYLREISDLRAEADALRDEVEWLRSFLPPMAILVSAVEEEFCSELTEVSEPDHSKVSYPEEDCPITFGMIREARKAVDYAMGDYA